MHRALRVAVLCRILWDGGVQRVAIDQTIALRHLGYDCDLIFLRRTEDATIDTPPGTLVLLHNDYGRSRRLRRLLQRVTAIYAGHRGKDATVDLDLLWRARIMLRSYDIVIYHDQWAASIGAFNRIFHMKPYILFLHELYPKVPTRFGMRPLFLIADMYDILVLLLSNVTITHSKKNLSRLRKLIGSRVALARVGCSTPESVSMFEQKDPSTVIAVTQWDTGRHPELYATIAELLPQYEFVLAGRWLDPEYRRQFEGRFSKVRNLHITGPVSKEKLESLYRTSLFYMRFGYEETGPGMGGLDALSYGCITISNQGIGLSELISNGTNGFVVDSIEPPVVARLLTRLSQMEKDDWKRLSDAAIETARQWTWKRHAESVGAQIGRLIGKSDFDTSIHQGI
jgi:glycosyltransferase involved in cell wall biosynthesis